MKTVKLRTTKPNQANPKPGSTPKLVSRFVGLDEYGAVNAVIHITACGAIPLADAVALAVGLNPAEQSPRSKIREDYLYGKESVRAQKYFGLMGRQGVHRVKSDQLPAVETLLVEPQQVFLWARRIGIELHPVLDAWATNSDECLAAAHRYLKQREEWLNFDEGDDDGGGHEDEEAEDAIQAVDNINAQAAETTELVTETPKFPVWADVFRGDMPCVLPAFELQIPPVGDPKINLESRPTLENERPPLNGSADGTDSEPVAHAEGEPVDMPDDTLLDSSEGTPNEFRRLRNALFKARETITLIVLNGFSKDLHNNCWSRILPTDGVVEGANKIEQDVEPFDLMGWKKPISYDTAKSHVARALEKVLGEEICRTNFPSVHEINKNKNKGIKT